MERELKKENFAQDLLSVNVEFKEALPSSLDLPILVEFAGKAARHYDKLTRTVPQIAVEASSQYGWVIPFSQVTIDGGGPTESADFSPPAGERQKITGALEMKNIQSFDEGCR